LKEVFYIFVPTITPEVDALNVDIMKKMALELNSDFATLRQVFSGSGIGCLRRTGNKKLALELVDNFKQFDIPFSAVSLSVLSKTSVINAHKVKIEGLGFTVRDDNGQSVFFPFDKIAFFGSDTGISKTNVKNSLLKCKKVAIGFEDMALVIDIDSVVYENLENYNKYSKVNSSINFIELLIEKSKEAYFDRSYNSLKFQFDNSFRNYAALLAKAVKKELYKGLPEKYYHVEKNKVKKQVSFNYTIYRGMALYKRKMKLSKIKQSFGPFDYLMTTAFVLIFVFFQVGGYPLLVLATALFTAGFVLQFFSLSKLKNYISDIPTSKLRSVSAGLVEVKGRITANEVFISPISGAECVFFRYRKYKKVRTRDADYWNIIEMGEGIPSKCFINDDTGLIALNLKNAEINVKSPAKYTATYKEMEAGFIPGFFSNIKYEEETIQTGESVYVLGTAKPESQSIQFGAFLSEAKKNPANIERFDMDGNGVLDQQEWELAVADLKHDFRKKVLENGQSFGLILDKDSHHNLLVVATEKEDDLLSRLKWKVPVYFVLGIISFVCLIISILIIL